MMKGSSSLRAFFVYPTRWLPQHLKREERQVAEEMSNGVTVLDYDHGYRLQPMLQNPAYEWLDLSDIPGTKRYCTVESLSVIRQRLRKRKKRGVTLIGSGNYHYVTYLLLSEIQQPFTLVLFDHHTDMSESLDAGVVSCGSWVRKAVEELPLLRKVVIVGARPSAMKHVPLHLQEKVTLVTQLPMTSHAPDPQTIVSRIPTQVVYVSIDKDVLDRTEAITDWDQGTMRMRELVGLLRAIAASRQICGIDICGEYVASPVDRFRADCRQALKKNEIANRKLLETIRTLGIKCG